MLLEPQAARAASARAEWIRQLPAYERPSTGLAVRQLVDTLLPYAALWVLMVSMLRSGLAYWSVLPLIVLAAGFLIRVFIIFHDCGHGSFLGSHRLNRLVGYVTGILVFTPYEDWRRAHALHHASAGDLDRRGDGDIWTLTVEEYRTAPFLKRLAYRLFRNPIVLFGIAPSVVFLLTQRFAHRGGGSRERLSVLLTNVAVAGLVTAAAFTIGLKAYVLIQVPMLALAAGAGVWLFYVQHQFEGVYWSRHGEWDPFRAALEGSSYYRLPKVLQWFTGNIGLHHVHHLRSRIPNYNLQRCVDDLPALQTGGAMTLGASLRSLRLHLWDERHNRLVSFAAARAATW